MLQESTYEPLIVEVSDRTPGLKQKVRLEKTSILETLAGLSVKLKLEVIPYAANADGSYGEPLAGNGIVRYPVYLTADNFCAVDPATGEPIYQLLTLGAVKDMRSGTISLLPEGTSFPDFVKAAPEQLALQGDWFAALLTQAAPVRALQARFILAADQPPYRKFGEPAAPDVIPAAPGSAVLLPHPDEEVAN